MRYTFKYPDYGTPVGFPEHLAHSGQECEVIGEELDVDVEVEPLFYARFSDGMVLAVFQSELSPEPASQRTI